MADKAISELVAAEQITATDMFVLEQNNTAKKLTGQILLNWLTKAADGHGGISSIEKLSTSGLTDTYRITLADKTTFDFTVENGKGISGIAKQSASDLVDTYQITYNDSTYTTFTVTNGAKGDKGDNAYLWIKYASQEPTSTSHSLSDIPDNWIGVYSGNSSTAPTDYTQYQWFQYKGEKGDTGDPATLSSSKVEYQVSDSGTIIPSGTWSTSVPVVAQGKYLWTRTTTTFNTGSPVEAYSVGRMGMDGSGSVSSVANISPDSDGNVLLTATDVGALPGTGGDLTGELRMNGQPISGLNPPTEGTNAANKGYVDTAVSRAAPVNLLDNSDFTNPVNQRGETSYPSGSYRYTLDRWYASAYLGVEISDGGVTISGEESVGGYYGLSQRIPYSKVPKSGEAFTFAVHCADGTTGIFSGVAPASGATTKIGQGGTVIANVYAELSFANTSYAQLSIYVKTGETLSMAQVALYEGEYTAETLPVYQPKGYGAELLECQRYYVSIQSAVFSGHLTSSSKRFYSQSLPEIMHCRITPTISMTGTIVCRTVSGYSTAAGFDTSSGGDVGLLSGIAVSTQNGLMLTFADTAASVNNAPFTVDFAGTLTLSADL